RRFLIYMSFYISLPLLQALPGAPFARLIFSSPRRRAAARPFFFANRMAPFNQRAAQRLTTNRGVFGSLALLRDLNLRRHHSTSATQTQDESLAATRR